MENMAGEPLISVIVPVYNIEQYIAPCIESILSQSYRNMEIILVDDGSTDASGQICDAYGRQNAAVRVIHKPNGGLSDARNTGISAAHGAYLTLVDGDDIIHPRCLRLLLDTLLQNHTAISVCKIRRFYDGKEARFLHKDFAGEPAAVLFSPKAALKEMLYEGRFSISASGKLYRADLFDGIRYPLGSLFEDLATTHKLVGKAQQIAFVPCSLYGYRQRYGSITHTPFHIRMLDIIQACDAFCGYAEAHCTDCMDAVTYRKAKTATMILERIADSEDSAEYKEVAQRMQAAIRADLARVLRNGNVQWAQKLKILCGACNIRLLRLAYRACEKLYYYYDCLTG